MFVHTKLLEGLSLDNTFTLEVMATGQQLLNEGM